MECREEERECRRDWWSEGDGDAKDKLWLGTIQKKDPFSLIPGA